MGSGAAWHPGRELEVTVQGTEGFAMTISGIDAGHFASTDLCGVEVRSRRGRLSNGAAGLASRMIRSRLALLRCRTRW